MKTDIDAIFYDIKIGSLALVQLKWQDPFGGLKERYSRKTKFISNGNKWVESVSNWITEIGSEEILKRLKLDQVKCLKINSVHLFIVGRYFSDFSGEDERDPRAAWTNWARLEKLILGNTGNEAFVTDPIHWLREKLSLDNRLMIKEDYESNTMNLYDYTIEIPNLDFERFVENLQC